MDFDVVDYMIFDHVMNNRSKNPLADADELAREQEWPEEDEEREWDEDMTEDDEALY